MAWQLKLCCWSRWSWNANSRPPSGLVTPQESLSLGWDKVNALTAQPNALTAAAPNATAGLGFGLLLWYLRQPPPAPAATPAPSAAATG